MYCICKRVCNPMYIGLFCVIQCESMQCMSPPYTSTSITVFRVFFNDENFTYGEGDRITSVCLDARGIIVQDNVTVTVSSITTGTAVGKMNTSSYRF